MLRFRLGQCHRFSYVHPQVQIALRDLTLFTTTYYPNARLIYNAQPSKGISSGSGKKEMQDASIEDKKELKRAIEQGDRIGDTARVDRPVRRRALIVAPVYDHARLPDPGPDITGIQWMPTTTRDAVLMHSTLTARGYDPANIRILADGDLFGPTNYPTRENIMDSLKWLVTGAAPGDYRFFHFSGHGVRRDSEKGKGKESRKVETKAGLWDAERARHHYFPPRGRLPSHRIKAKNLTYYNEALVARISGGIHGEQIQGQPFYIHDSELNAHFARLPPESNLTCVIDSCASGRILSNNVKLKGRGFRGINLEDPWDKILNWTEEKKREWLGDKMKEELPEEERMMDKIRANMFTWTACHQRQESVQYDGLRSSLFTRVWTEALAKDADQTPLKIGELFENVSEQTLELAKGQNNYWQYAQLWTSSADGTISAELQASITLRVCVLDSLGLTGEPKDNMLQQRVII